MVMLIEGKWSYYSLLLQKWFQIKADSDEISNEDWNMLFALEDAEVKRREKYRKRS